MKQLFKCVLFGLVRFACLLCCYCRYFRYFLYIFFCSPLIAFRLIPLSHSFKPHECVYRYEVSAYVHTYVHHGFYSEFSIFFHCQQPQFDIVHYLSGPVTYSMGCWVLPETFQVNLNVAMTNSSSISPERRAPQMYFVVCHRWLWIINLIFNIRTINFSPTWKKPRNKTQYKYKSDIG